MQHCSVKKQEHEQDERGREQHNRAAATRDPVLSRRVHHAHGALLARPAVAVQPVPQLAANLPPVPGVAAVHLLPLLRELRVKLLLELIRALILLRELRGHGVSQQTGGLPVAAAVSCLIKYVCDKFL